jgi:hypothetical protein
VPSHVDIDILLKGFAVEDIKWIVDYRQATHEEAMCWLKAELAFRSEAALLHGRYVEFQGKQWRAKDRMTCKMY